MSLIVKERDLPFSLTKIGVIFLPAFLTLLYIGIYFPGRDKSPAVVNDDQKYVDNPHTVFKEPYNDFGTVIMISRNNYKSRLYIVW